MTVTAYINAKTGCIQKLSTIQYKPNKMIPTYEFHENVIFFNNSAGRLGESYMQKKSSLQNVTPAVLK